MDRKTCLGCGGVAAFLVAALVAAIVIGGPRLWQKGKSFVETQVAEWKRLEAFEKAWQPPSEAPDALWFPAQIDGRQLVSNGAVSAPAALQPGMDGPRPMQRAVYRQGSDELIVEIVAVSAEEKAALFPKAREALEKEDTTRVKGKVGSVTFEGQKSGGHVTTSSGDRAFVRTGETNQTRLWWLNGWLFYFRTHNGDDPDAFAQRYLELIQKQDLEAR